MNRKASLFRRERQNPRGFNNSDIINFTQPVYWDVVLTLDNWFEIRLDYFNYKENFKNDFEKNLTSLVKQ